MRKLWFVLTPSDALEEAGLKFYAQRWPRLFAIFFPCLSELLSHRRYMARLTYPVHLESGTINVSRCCASQATLFLHSLHVLGSGIILVITSMGLIARSGTGPSLPDLCLSFSVSIVYRHFRSQATVCGFRGGKNLSENKEQVNWNLDLYKLRTNSCAQQRMFYR